jgi:hypothetical protein
MAHPQKEKLRSFSEQDHYCLEKISRSQSLPAAQVASSLSEEGGKGAKTASKGPFKSLKPLGQGALTRYPPLLLKLAQPQLVQPFDVEGPTYQTPFPQD